MALWTGGAVDMMGLVGSILMLWAPDQKAHAPKRSSAQKW